MNARFDLERLRELLAQRALAGLDGAERAELRALLAAARAQHPPDTSSSALSSAALGARDDADLALDLDPEGEAAAAAALHLALVGALPRRVPAALRRDLEWGAAAWLAGRELPAERRERGPAQPTPRAPAPRRFDAWGPAAPARLGDRAPRPATERKLRDSKARRLALAAAALLLGLAALWMLRPAPESAPAPAERRAELLARADALRIDWSTTADPLAQGVTGDVVWSPGAQAGYMRLVGLAPNDPRRNQYQLWIFDARRPEATPVDGGVFDIGPQGEVLVPIEAKLEVFEPTLFAVTLEPPGGVVVSTRERLLLAAAVTR